MGATPTRIPPEGEVSRVPVWASPSPPDLMIHESWVRSPQSPLCDASAHQKRPEPSGSGRLSSWQTSRPGPDAGRRVSMAVDR